MIHIQTYQNPDIDLHLDFKILSKKSTNQKSKSFEICLSIAKRNLRFWERNPQANPRFEKSFEINPEASLWI